MKQDVGFFDIGGSTPDLVIENGDLKAANGLENAALISLFSDRRVSLEELPRGESDRRGWWADLISDPQGDLIGSKLWKLESIGKVNDSTAIELQSILEEAFNWMLDDGISSRISVFAERIESNRIQGSVQIQRPNGENIPFDFLWNGQRLKITEGK